MEHNSMAYSFVVDFLTGMAVGLEFMGFDDEDFEEEGVRWAIVFHLFILRLSIVKHLAAD